MKKTCIRLLVLTIIGGCLFSCEKGEPPLVEELPCLEGEFRQHNPHCGAFLGKDFQGPEADAKLYDIKIYNHAELDSIAVPGISLPESFRVKGQRFYFQLDSVGINDVCNHLFGRFLPHFISKISSTPCGDPSRE